MNKLITLESEISKYNEKFIKSITENEITQTVEGCTVIHQGHKPFKNVAVYYIEEKGFWLYPREIDNRYWNAFGIQDPKEINNLTITAEINFAYNGLKEVAGLFYKDNNENIYVGHRGKISIGKKKFWNLYEGDSTIVYDDNKKSEQVAIIGSLNDAKLIENISTFVREVERIKRFK